VARPAEPPDSRSPRVSGLSSLTRLFESDPVAAVLAVLDEAAQRNSSAGLSAEEIKGRLRDGGVPDDQLTRWRGIRGRIAADERVWVGGDARHRTYRLADLTARMSPREALALLAAGTTRAARRTELVRIVGGALADTDRDEARGEQLDPVVLARLEQREKDAIRALAELAIEVEELAVNGASARALVHNVRILAGQANLSPIERAGEFAFFDRTRHQPIGAAIPDGAKVVVVRPGYIWKQSDEEITVARAVVQERSAP
jgi:hypothetical protein